MNPKRGPPGERRPSHRGTWALYFAFGSNLSEVQMRRRCPGAVLLGPASLHGQRLAFAGFSLRWGGAVATLLPARGGRVHGLLYRVSDRDLARLDRFEGAPDVYTRRERRVFDGARAPRVAHVYELAGEPAPLGEPSSNYILTLLRAYRQHGLALGALSSALAFSREASQ
jgi:gamma-glutamylcyclotransferase